MTFQKLVSLQPNDSAVRFNLGTALFNKGDYRVAADSYREAIRLKPDFAHAHYNLGMSLLRLNENTSAQTGFDEARLLDSTLNPPTGVSK